jgi:hypothetical protein
MAAEDLYNRLPGKLPFAIFMSKWIKRDAAGEGLKAA